MMPIPDLLEYYGPLHDDVEQCLAGIEIGENIEYWKRSYLRCLCTFVEARVYLLKMELKANHLVECPNFTPEILGFLDGTEWGVTSNGKVKSRVKITSPTDELKAVIKILGSFYPSLLWDFGSTRWTRVKELYKSRNGLVHPKSKMDISVSDKSIEDFEIFRKDFNEWSASIYPALWGKAW